MLIDTHAHLNFKAFRKNLDNVLWEAIEKGVEEIIVPGTDLDTSKRAVTLSTSYKNIFAPVGIHPHHVCEIKQSEEEIKSVINKLAKNNKVVAIGEIGLDYHEYPKTKYKEYCIDKNFKKKQAEIFMWQMDVARELNLPIIFHNRDANLEIVTLLKKYLSKKNSLRGVFHCFSGDKTMLSFVLKQGFFIGFDGNLTYEPNIQKIALQVPLEKILLETDSPFLTPEPLRSKKIFPNRPENITITANFLAQIKKVSVAKIEKVTTQSAKELFKLS